MATSAESLKAEQAKSSTQNSASATNSESAASTASSASTTATAISAKASAPQNIERLVLTDFSDTFREIIEDDRIMSFISYLQLECQNDAHGMLILFYAAQQGSVQITSQMLYDCPDFIFQKYNGKTLFDMADPIVYQVLMGALHSGIEGLKAGLEEAQSKDAAQFAILAEQRATLKEFSEIYEKNKKTMDAEYQGFLQSAAKARNATSFKGKSDEEILCNLAQYGKIISFKAILKTADSLELINKAIKGGYRPIHFAAGHDQLEILDFIVDVWRLTKVDDILLARNDEGQTAWMVAGAKTKKHPKFVKAYTKALSRSKPKTATDNTEDLKAKDDKAKSEKHIHDHNCNHHHKENEIAASKASKASTATAASSAATPSAIDGASPASTTKPKGLDEAELKAFPPEVIEAIREDSYEKLKAFVTEKAPEEEWKMIMDVLFYAVKNERVNILSRILDDYRAIVFTKTEDDKSLFSYNPTPEVYSILMESLDKEIDNQNKEPQDNTNKKVGEEAKKQAEENAALVKEFTEILHNNYKTSVTKARRLFNDKSDAEILGYLAKLGKITSFKAFWYTTPKAERFKLFNSPVDNNGNRPIHLASAYGKTKILDFMVDIYDELEDQKEKHELMLVKNKAGQNALDVATNDVKSYEDLSDIYEEIFAKNPIAKEERDLKIRKEKMDQERQKMEETVEAIKERDIYKANPEKNIRAKTNAEILFDLAGKEKTEAEIRAFIYCYPALLAFPTPEGFRAIHAAACYDRTNNIDIIVDAWMNTKNDQFLIAKSNNGKTAWDIAGPKAKQFRTFIVACGRAKQRQEQEEKEYIEKQKQRVITEEKRYKAMQQQSKQATAIAAASAAVGASASTANPQSENNAKPVLFSKLDPKADTKLNAEEEAYKNYEASVAKEISAMPKEILEAVKQDEPELFGSKLDQVKDKFLLLRHVISEGAVKVLQKVLPLIPEEIIFSEDKYGRHILDFARANHKTSAAIREILEKRIWQSEDFVNSISEREGGRHTNNIIEIKKKLILEIIEDRYGKQGYARPATVSTAAATVTAIAVDTKTTADKSNTFKKLVGKDIFLGEDVVKKQMEDIISTIAEDNLPKFAIFIQPIIDRIKEYHFPLNDYVVSVLRATLIQSAHEKKALNILFCYLQNDEIFVTPTAIKTREIETRHYAAMAKLPWEYRTPLSVDPLEEAARDSYEAEKNVTNQRNSRMKLD